MALDIATPLLMIYTHMKKAREEKEYLTINFRFDPDYRNDPIKIMTMSLMLPLAFIIIFRSVFDTKSSLMTSGMLDYLETNGLNYQTLNHAILTKEVMINGLVLALII